MSIKLVSTATVKIFLEVTSNNHDTLLDLINTQVSKRFETYLNRGLKKQERTEYFDIVSSRKSINLIAYPIDLSEDFTLTHYDEEEEINSDYWVYEDMGIVEFYYHKNHCTEPKCLKVVYTGGYEELYDGSENVLNVPDDIARAATYQIVYEFKNRRHIGATSTTTPDGSLSLPQTGNLLQEVVDLLRTYRNRPSYRL